MYGGSMSEYLPISNFKWNNDKSLSEYKEIVMNFKHD